MTRPLRSARITGPQRYYETVRPRAPRRYSAPHGDDRLGISLSPPARKAGDSVGATGSHVPCKSPGQARAAYMPDAIWAVSRLPPDLSRGPGPAPVSTPLRKLTTRQQRFAFARLPDPHLTRSSPRLFRSAHHERHLTDAACGGLRPPPAERPRRTYLHLLHSTASSGFYIDPPSAFVAHDLRFYDADGVADATAGRCVTRWRSGSGFLRAGRVAVGRSGPEDAGRALFAQGR